MPKTSAGGRSDVLKDLVDAVQRGRSLLVIGARGLGRTRLLTELAAVLAGGPTTVHLIRGSDGEADIPLVPFAPLLQCKNISPEQPLAAYTRLPPILARDRDIVLVDDVDQLDRASQVLLSQIARTETPCGVVTTTQDALPPSLRDVITGKRWFTTHLEPLDAATIVEISRTVLGAGLTPPAESRVVQHVQGNPTILTELLHKALESRQILTRPYGVDIGRLSTTPRVREIVGLDLVGLGPEATHLCEMLAVAGRLPRPVCPHDALDELASHRLIRFDSADQVLLRDPLLDDVVLDGLSPDLVRQRRVQAAEALTGRAEFKDRATLLLVRSAMPVESAVILAAARSAMAQACSQEALELLDVVLRQTADPTIRFEAHLHRADAYSTIDDHDRAEADLREAEHLATTDGDLVRLGRLLGLHHAARRAVPRAAVAEVSAVADRIGDAGQRHILETELIKWRLMAGERSEPSAVGDRSGSDPVGQALIGAMTETMGGSLDAAREWVRSGLAALPESADAPSFAGDLLRLSHFLCLAFSNDLLGATTSAENLLGQAQREAADGLGMWEYALAELALHTGRFALSADYANRAVQHLAWRDFTGLQPSATALLAAGRARLGDLRTAESLVRRLTPEHRSDAKVALHLARVEAERQLVAGNRLLAAETLFQAATLAVAQHHSHLGALLLDECFMLHPDPAVADQLQELGKKSDLIAVLGRRARIQLTGDATALEIMANDLADSMLFGRAVHAATTAAQLYAEAPSPSSARRAHGLAGQLTTERTAPVWPPADDTLPLTPRELDIAVLAARRVRSREIAEALNLSPRTVDNHLQRIFRKLRVSGRDELAAALPTVEQESP